MSKTRIINPYTYAIEMMTQMEKIPATGAYEIVKLTPSRMDYLSVQVMEYISI